ncbi:phage transcriptional regulator [Cupriavidus sp. HMR-1]|uniref:helix-turn-helix transcriptional regulator n=1 Tax=Cupriavidus sp. HMR-1 TaxID=1249621 RepID=UPI0002A1D5B5|nr:AlpA family phage regulatory protein [Cupriavidus sp. HMR-1]EKZ97628.1 phage transcriptional regulator [Cupriavidus sp. HMR-1]
MTKVAIRTALPEHGYVRERDLLASVLPISKATLWRWVKAGTFPPPVKLSSRVTAWQVEAVRAWLANPIAATS